MSTDRSPWPQRVSCFSSASGCHVWSGDRMLSGVRWIDCIKRIGHWLDPLPLRPNEPVLVERKRVRPRPIVHRHARWAGPYFAFDYRGKPPPYLGPNADSPAAWGWAARSARFHQWWFVPCLTLPSMRAPSLSPTRRTAGSLTGRESTFWRHLQVVGTYARSRTLETLSETRSRTLDQSLTAPPPDRRRCRPCTACRCRG